ncbi:MAG: hypothetical protein HYS44_03060 [Candidatus Niyogibacteria bacterium]|nr:hypothetical protein [Candidatus Niyogibacteria bacterium]
MFIPIYGLMMLLGLAAFLLWRARMRSLGVCAIVVLAGAFSNWLAVTVNGSHMPVIGTDLDGARLPWLCDIFHIPKLFHLTFWETDIVINSTDIAGYYSIGDFVIGAGIAAIALIILRWFFCKALSRVFRPRSVR